MPLRFAASIFSHHSGAWPSLRASVSTLSREMVKKGAGNMPKVEANNITINYNQQGTGEPLILIPYLAADYACYAFQVAEYAKHFTCISIDLRGTGESDKPEGIYSTELFADDVAAFMQAVGIPNAHLSGLSLGAATAMWLAAKYSNRVSHCPCTVGGRRQTLSS